MSEQKTKPFDRTTLMPLFISGLVLSVAFWYWDSYWSVPLVAASIISIVLLFLCMTALGIKGMQFKSYLCISIGGVFAAALHPDGQHAEALLIASLICSAIFLLGDLQPHGKAIGGGSSQDMPWNQMIESLQMSENAKRVLFRERELELFRKTVQADIVQGDLHAALVHCDQMGTVFGAVEEAEALRTKVQHIIHEQHEARILNEMKNLQSMLDKKMWVESYQDAARLRRLFPESPHLHEIEQHIADVRTEYRHGLEDRFMEVAQQNDPEKAMLLLRELDGYLTPDEARRFRDTAATVISTYRENLGARFKMAVSDHRWQEAVEFGEELVKQFPNSKMSQEATVILDSIKERTPEEETAS